MGIDVDKAVEHAEANAETAPTKYCARYVRKALEAGGADLSHHPIYAKNYGPTLLAIGFVQVHEFSEMQKAEGQAKARESDAPDYMSPFDMGGLVRWNEYRGVLLKAAKEAPEGGEGEGVRPDVVVIQSYQGGNPAGHIAIYSGTIWISDFKQKDMWGGAGYRKHKPTAVVYRPR